MNLSPLPIQKFFANNGEPLAGGLLYTYVAGTTTKIATYTDSTGASVNTNPIVLDYRGEAPVWLNPLLAYKFTLSPSGDTDPPTKAIRTVDMIESSITIADLTQQFLGAIIYPRTAAEIAASVTPTDYAYPTGNVLRYGADPSGVSNSATAITNSLASNARSWIPDGDYRVDSSITVNSGKSLILSSGAELIRGGSATTPVVYVLGTYSEFRGGTITTANASPNGIVVLGHADTTSDTNAWWWRFTDCDVFGRVNSAGDIGVYVPSGQVDFPLRANYFGLIQNVNIFGTDVQMYLPELANAHNINNINFWDGKTAGLRLRGAYANNVCNMFFHQAAVDGYIAVNLQDQVDPGGQHHSIFNQIVNWTSETTNTNDKSLVLEANCSINCIVGGSNVLGGYTISNANNHIILNGSTVASVAITTKAMTVNGAASVTGAATVGSLVFGTAGSAKQVSTSTVASGSAQFITTAGFLSTAPAGAALVTVNISDTTNGNLCRTDLVLLSIRSSAHSASTVTAIGNAFTTTGTTGEPTAAVYTLDFAGGATVPRLKANITRQGGAGNFDVRVTAVTA